MSSYLPCGVTDSMCEPPVMFCGSCGHESEFHYEDKDIIYNNDGQIEYACDHAHKGVGDTKIQCTCTGFDESEYEPDYDEDDF